MPKVFSAEMAMKALNPFIDVRPYHRRLDEAAARAGKFAANTAKTSRRDAGIIGGPGSAAAGADIWK